MYFIRKIVAVWAYLRILNMIMKDNEIRVK